MIFKKSRKDQTGGSPPPPILRCSFCNKAQHDVKKLIAGPTVYICDGCVDICNEIIAEGGPFAKARTVSWQPETPRGVEGVILEHPPAAARPYAASSAVYGAQWSSVFLSVAAVGCAVHALTR